MQTKVSFLQTALPSASLKKYIYWCYFPHQSRDLVSPLCGIFFILHAAKGLLIFERIIGWIKYRLLPLIKYTEKRSSVKNFFKYYVGKA